MAKPVILTVDDDPDVLQSIERDLRSRYSERYRIMRAASANEALDVLHHRVAVFLAFGKARQHQQGRVGHIITSRVVSYDVIGPGVKKGIGDALP